MKLSDFSGLRLIESRAPVRDVLQRPSSLNYLIRVIFFSIFNWSNYEDFIYERKNTYYTTSR